MTKLDLKNLETRAMRAIQKIKDIRDTEDGGWDDDLEQIDDVLQEFNSEFWDALAKALVQGYPKEAAGD